MLAACAESDPCARVNARIEEVRTGDAETLASDRISLRASRGVRILERGAFTPMGHERLHQCLGPNWRGGVETSLRGGWRAPAIVYARAGWPDVVLLDDGEKLEIRIEESDEAR